MRGIQFDISIRRFNPVWLITGAVIGRAAGLMAGMNFALWFFAQPSVLLGWQIFGAIAGALFLSFVMTSDAIPHVKWGIFGLGGGFALVFYIGEILAALSPGASVKGLAGMGYGEAIFFEWAYIHAAWIGAIIGIVAGSIIAKRQSGQKKVKEETGPVIPADESAPVQS